MNPRLEGGMMRLQLRITRKMLHGRIYLEQRMRVGRKEVWKFLVRKKKVKNVYTRVKTGQIKYLKNRSMRMQERTENKFG